MRDTLLASLLVLTAACTTEPSALVPAQASLPSEPLALSVRGTQGTGPVGPSAPAAPRAPIASSTSPTGPVWIETTCQDTPIDAQVAQFKLEYPATTAIDLGKAALLVDHGKRQQLTAWDADSSCRIDITGPKDVDAVAIARTLLGTLRS
ncbi:MAG: hypothetical protein JNL83_24605 [Myxococcales bacterium]|nr:hypothetical protein [Myxococcales bacterium]